MKKIGFLVGLICFAWTSVCFGQNMFWSFDDSQNPLPIPPECDARFDEVRGGVFMPTVDEMYEYGMSFLGNPALSVQQQGSYCLMGAALQGHPDAQYQIAKMYEGGRVLPQDDLSAYKWAFIAALNGNKQAEKLTLILEQFLTTEDLEKTSGAIEETMMQVRENIQKQIEEEREKAEKDKKDLEEITNELSGISSTVVETPDVQESDTQESDLELPLSEQNITSIYDESDRM